ncbi:hypothetical protein Micbo1qcDRAFT_9413 [Microdochium bolleyi]|uniref:Uncharacterized protein n=1 Tax=Microdochium bolleyi TaxID=196109 RepID=A0A136JKL4_9PEZI|nr:hypothetical protein Micbo1qcDRAFT_9413 [Microdochium bolleyi]
MTYVKRAWKHRTNCLNEGRRHQFVPRGKLKGNGQRGARHHNRPANVRYMPTKEKEPMEVEVDILKQDIRGRVTLRPTSHHSRDVSARRGGPKLIKTESFMYMAKRGYSSLVCFFISWVFRSLQGHRDGGELDAIETFHLLFDYHHIDSPRWAK